MTTVTNARPRTWTARRVSDAVHAAGLTYTDLARQLGCSRPFVSLVASGKNQSWRVASAIAEAIGRKPWEIWPRLYAAPESPSEEPMTAPTTAPEPIPHAC
jgi:lambda repressor-like predicted transcriptional regulator